MTRYIVRRKTLTRDNGEQVVCETLASREDENYGGDLHKKMAGEIVCMFDAPSRQAAEIEAKRRNGQLNDEDFVRFLKEFCDFFGYDAIERARA